MKFILFLLITVASQFCFAGVRVGNGGDALLCYQDSAHQNISSIDMFDYWEHAQLNLHLGALDLGDIHLTVQEKISLVVQRLMKFDPKLANEINVIALSVANNINAFLVTQNEIPEITDANPKALPKNSNCFITQFAIQWENTQDGIRRFYISSELYNNPVTTNNTRVGLILHEAIYRYAITNGATNSDGVRFFNYNLATTLFDQANLIQYVDVLNNSLLNYRRCTLLKEPYSDTLHIDQNNQSCFAGSLRLNNQLIVKYTDQQLSYEPSSQSIRLSKQSIDFFKFTNGLFIPFKNKIKKFELRKNYLTIGLTENSRTRGMDIPELRFNNKILNSLLCINKITYDLMLDSVIECEIDPHFMQLPNGSSFTIWRRVLFNGSNITFNFQQPAEIEMNVKSKKKILIDPSYPALFSYKGILLNGWSLKDITFSKNAYIGKTKEFSLLNNKMEFFISEKLEPLYLGFKVILEDKNSDLLSLCTNKSADFSYERHSTTHEYITTPEKVYIYSQNVVTFISDSYVDRLDSLDCHGSFLIDASLL